MNHMICFNNLIKVFNLPKLKWLAQAQYGIHWKNYKYHTMMNGVFHFLWLKVTEHNIIFTKLDQTHFSRSWDEIDQSWPLPLAILSPYTCPHAWQLTWVIFNAVWIKLAIPMDYNYSYVMLSFLQILLYGKNDLKKRVLTNNY